LAPEALAAQKANMFLLGEQYIQQVHEEHTTTKAVFLQNTHKNNNVSISSP
jgi:hypothetical protein